MGCTVAELEQRVSYAEYLEWMEFYEIEPFGLHADDQISAQTKAVILAAAGAKNVNPADMMLFDEARLELPDDVDAAERAMMLKLMRVTGD